MIAKPINNDLVIAMECNTEMTERNQQQIPPTINGLNFKIFPDKNVGIPYKTNIKGLKHFIGVEVPIPIKIDKHQANKKHKPDITVYFTQCRF